MRPEVRHTRDKLQNRLDASQRKKKTAVCSDASLDNQIAIMEALKVLLGDII